MNDNLIIQAARFAAERHSGQVRKHTSAPYITHPGRVAARVTLIDGATAELIAAAWLHDVVEDTTTPITEIETRFGGLVAAIVQGLTHVYTKEAFPDLNRHQRKQREYERMCGQPRAVRQIKLVDRIDNLGEIDPFDDFTRVYMLESQTLLDAVRGTDAVLEAELVEVLRRLAAVRAQAKAEI